MENISNHFDITPMFLLQLSIYWWHSAVVVFTMPQHGNGLGRLWQK